MAPRAAARLESLGFTEVFEYTAGKLDWLAAGLLTEGDNSTRPRAGDASRKDVVVCRLTDRLGDVRDRAKEAGQKGPPRTHGEASEFAGLQEIAVVIDESRLVLGLLRSKQLEMDPKLLVEQAMRPGPSTFRTYVPIKEMADYLVEHELDSAPITTSDGKLVGVLFKSDAIGLAASATAAARRMISATRPG
jgi:CBS domain-containing protein